MVPYKSHNLDQCYCNPRSKLFKSGLWKWRVKDLVKAKQPVPFLMKWEDGLARLEKVLGVTIRVAAKGEKLQGYTGA